MVEITNDNELRLLLNRLSVSEQRALGGLFVKNLSHLSSDARVARAIEVACDPQRSELAMNEAFRGAKNLSIQTYTACGRDADWLAQAEHFLAAAAAACLMPDQERQQANLAWKAAVQARMAKNCEMIEKDQGEVDNEAQKQFALAETFLAKRA